jgi:Tfp pilus assembly protein PilO
MNLNNIKKTNYQQKISFLIIFFSIFTIIIYYFLINKEINKIQQNKISIIQKKNDIESQINKEKNKSILISKIKDIEPEIKKLDAIFINKNKELEFITTIEGIAQKNNVTQEIVLNNNQKKEETDYIKIPIILNVHGNFSNIMNYLETLEKNKYGINIKLISIFNNDEDLTIAKKNISMNISANTYWK